MPRRPAAIPPPAEREERNTAMHLSYGMMGNRAPERREVQSYTITIPGWRPTSLNKLMRLHYHKANRVKQEDARMLLHYAMLCGVPEATGPRRVSIHTVLAGHQKAVDPDALWKVVLDGLVKAKRLVDDSAAYCTLGPVTSERGARGSTAIKLEEI